MFDQPGPDEILVVAAAMLRSELLPALPPDLAFKARVLANALDLVGRQVGAGEAAGVAAQARLAALLGREGDTLELTALLAERIEAGAIALDDPALLQHLWATTLAKIAVDQPGYASYRAENVAPPYRGE